MKENVVYVQGVEKAIKEKYGDEAVQDPRANWDEAKEEEYQKQRLEMISEKNKHKREKTDVGGFLVSRKLLNRQDNRDCPICEKYSFEIKDDVYIKKFSCCYDCFIQHVEGREERWEEKRRKLLNDNR
ncbi:MAG TPA: hypothetical protein VMW36_06425 [Patescibacteria group bacterium]|nr:hypothetical protein [Patescibacteria group bacterium]